jgi:hypothetical protein
MTEHNIEIPCNTEVAIRVSCKEVAVEPILVTDPLPFEPTPEPIIEAISEPEIDPVPTPDPMVETIPVIDPNPPATVEPEPIPPVIIDSPVTPPVPDPLPPVVEPIPVVINEPSPPIPIPAVELLPAASPEHCYCDLDSPLSLPDFVKQLTTLSKGLLYPSESDFPIEVLTKGFSSKMPPIKGIEVRNLDRVISTFLRTENTRWQALYNLIKQHASVTAWHYPVKQKKYTHELIVILRHPQGTVALRTKLVET